jgi:hypothetical protein
MSLESYRAALIPNPSVQTSFRWHDVNKIMRHILVTIFVLLFLLRQGATTEVLAAPCFSDEAARSLEQKAHLIPLSQAEKTARSQTNGELIGARLCTSQNKLLYRATTLGPSGQLKNTWIDGHSGKVIELEKSEAVRARPDN